MGSFANYFDVARDPITFTAGAFLCPSPPLPTFACLIFSPTVVLPAAGALFAREGVTGALELIEQRV